MPKLSRPRIWWPRFWRPRFWRPRFWRGVLGLGAVVVAAVAAVAAGVGFGGASSPPAGRSGQPPGTARVTRGTLTQTERVNGTLGYGRATTLSARPAQGTGAPGRVGTLTWLAAVGATVRPGQPVYRVDDRPVVLLAGVLPLYRVLGDGVTGADVRELEANLRAFGYFGFTVDSRYTAATAAAVRRWQGRLGVPRTGRVDVDQVVVSAGPVRVAGQRAELGAPAAGPVLLCTGTGRVVTLALDAARQRLVRVGLAATVTLPDGGTVTGRVVGVGTVASPGPPGPGGQLTESTVDVTVSIVDQRAVGGLDGAPVQLTLVVAQRPDVLTVPVGALLALPDGGYAVQVLAGTGSSSRWLPVRTGMFAGGRVEVSGPGLVEGLVVGVPA
jgi:peptidoglycan hydrolase-like protein with peptidoglycan-binding domain